MPQQDIFHISHQAQQPHGLGGRIFGWFKEHLNVQSYKWALVHLQKDTPLRVLEIGFGTGKLAALCLKSGSAARYAGVDPSGLMLETATRRLAKQGLQIPLDLRTGTDATLDWPDGSFDAVLAVHCFQFWADPAATLARLHALLAPEGTFVLILRMHGKHPPKWLPNPCCHVGDERAAARKALVKAGFVITHDKRINSMSYGLAMRRP